MLSVTRHGDIWHVLCIVRYGLAAAERSTFDHVAPVCLPNRRCHPHSHHHRLVLHLDLHHRHLDRFVVLCPPSSHLKCQMVRPPSPADAATARRFDRRHSNVTHDMHDTLQVGPSQATTYCRTWGFSVYRIVQDSFVRSLPLFRFELPLSFFYLPFLLSHRTRDDTAPFTPGSVLVYNIATLAGLGQGDDHSRTLSMQ